MKQSSPESINTTVEFAGMSLASPVTVASGTFGAGREFSDFVSLEDLGAVITKGVSPVAWSGNTGRRIVETTGGMLNSIGLQNPGVESFIKHDLAWLRENAPKARLFVNVCGHSKNDFVEVVERLEQEVGVSAYEINISCPNVDAGGMAFGVKCDAAADIISAVRAATKRPVIAKLTPNVTDITEIARAVESAGADGISLINTVLGMAIDAHSFAPVLKRGVGGLSGPAIKPIALRMVHETSKAVSIPLIGMGGVSSGIDVVEFMLAGATLVAIGTANFKDPRATALALDELKDFCSSHGIGAASDLIGALKEGA